MKEFEKKFDPPASDSIVSRWERGISSPNNERLKKISELGNISMLYLTTGKKTIKDLTDDEIGELKMNTTDKIKQWAIDRNLNTASPEKQVLKLGEEFGELCEGMAKDRIYDVQDAIGDMYVVMTILSMQMDLDVLDCIEMAYDEIKGRKGVMKNGVFVKESDL